MCYDAVYSVPLCTMPQRHSLHEGVEGKRVSELRHLRYVLSVECWVFNAKNLQSFKQFILYLLSWGCGNQLDLMKNVVKTYKKHFLQMNSFNP